MFISTELVDDELRGELTELNERLLTANDMLLKAQIRAAELFKFIRGFNDSMSEFVAGFDDESMNESYAQALDMLASSAPYGVTLTGVEQEFEVEVQVTGTMTVRHIVRVNAISQDAAINRVAEDPDFYVETEDVLVEAAANGEGWDLVDVSTW